MFYAHLADRAVISISGDDAFVFLQGLVSNDVMRLKKGESVYAALLTAQGKFLHDFFLMPQGDSILLDCNKQGAADLLARLAMYKLRSKVTLEAKDDAGVVAVWGEDSGSGFRASEAWFSDPRMPQLGWRFIGNSDAISARCKEQGMTAADDKAYERCRLSLGVPDGAYDMVREKSLLLEFGFEDLHGVDFAKGCYVGQEVTARSKYRGQMRRFIYQVQAEVALPPCGTPVTLDGVAAGELRSGQNGTGLALLNVAMVGNAQSRDHNFEAKNVVFKASLPRWAMHPPKALTIEE